MDQRRARLPFETLLAASLPRILDPRRSYSLFCLTSHGSNCSGGRRVASTSFQVLDAVTLQFTIFPRELIEHRQTELHGWSRELSLMNKAGFIQKLRIAKTTKLTRLRARSFPRNSLDRFSSKDYASPSELQSFPNQFSQNKIRTHVKGSLSSARLRVRDLQIQFEILLHEQRTPIP